LIFAGEAVFDLVDRQIGIMPHNMGLRNMGFCLNALIEDRKTASADFRQA